MAYLHTFANGEKYKTNYHNHGLLGQIGVDITQEKDVVTVDFSRANMASVETTRYMDALRNSKDLACSSNGRQLTVTGKAAEFRHVANIVAQKAMETQDRLGQNLVEAVKAKGDKVDPHAAMQAFRQSVHGTPIHARMGHPRPAPQASAYKQ